MELKKSILIITDGSDAVTQTAAAIADAANALDGAIEARVVEAQAFQGTDLLPAACFFIGCGQGEPASFAYLADMLAHINLAGRSCGLFPAGAEAGAYLDRIVRDCGARVSHLGGKTAPAELAAWVKTVIKEG